MGRDYKCPECGEMMDTVETCCSISYWCDTCQKQFSAAELDELIREEHTRASCCGD